MHPLTQSQLDISWQGVLLLSGLSKLAGGDDVCHHPVPRGSSGLCRRGEWTSTDTVLRSCAMDSEGCDITCDILYQASPCVIVLFILKERQISLVD